MADVKEEEFDLAFLDEDNIYQDETDAVSTRLIQLEKDSEIPTRYLIRKIFSPHLEPPYHYHPAAEESQRRKKVPVLLCGIFFFSQSARSILCKAKRLYVDYKSMPPRDSISRMSALQDKLSLRLTDFRQKR